MNYVDAIDLSGENTPPVNTEQPPVQTLNEEVNDVIGQFSSFWGGFRKQASLIIVHRGLKYFDDTVSDRTRVK